MKKHLTKLLLALSVTPVISLFTVSCSSIDVYDKVVTKLKINFKDNGWTMQKQPNGFYTLLQGAKGKSINVNFHGGRSSSSQVNLTNWSSDKKVVTAVNDELLNGLAVNGAFYKNGPSNKTGVLDTLFKTMSGDFYGQYVKQVFLNPTEDSKTAFSGLKDLNYTKFMRYEDTFSTLDKNLFLLSQNSGKTFIDKCTGTPPITSTGFSIKHVYLAYSLYANTNAKGEVIIPFENLPVNFVWVGPNT